MAKYLLTLLPFFKQHLQINSFKNIKIPIDDGSEDVKQCHLHSASVSVVMFDKPLENVLIPLLTVGECLCTEYS